MIGVQYMNIQAAFFDKDGTLLDFDAFWVSVSVAAIEDILRRVEREDILISELISAIGVKDGITDPDGLLCRGTYRDIGLKFCEILTAHGVTLTDDKAVMLTNDAYTRCSEAGEIKPVCDGLRDTLLQMKKLGIKLILVTTDNPNITRKCLEGLNLLDLFDRVVADDGVIPPKPDPSFALEFSAESGIPLENAVMVGDTITDIKFARNAGMHMIYVGKSDEAGRQADAHITDVSHIFELIGENSWFTV